MTTPVAADRAALATSAVVVYTSAGDRWAHVRAAIASLAAQTHRPDRILLVVDHDPGLAARARGFFAAPVVVLENRRRAGSSGARNTALDALTESADGMPEVVAFLDDDAAARPDWLARTLTPFEDPAVAAVVGVAAPTVPTGRRGTPGAGGAFDVRDVTGGASAFHRDALLATGGFGEDRGAAPAAESELHLRLRCLVPGARIVLDPEAVVDREAPPDLPGWHDLVRRYHAAGVLAAVVTRHDPRGRRSTAATRLHGPGTAQSRGLRGSVAVSVALAAAGTGYVRGRLTRGATPPPGAPVTAVDAALTTGLVATPTGLAAVLLAVLPAALGA